MISRNRWAALAIAGAIGVFAVLPSTTMAAAPQFAKLYITPAYDQPGYYLVVVDGHFNHNGSSTVGMRLKGDDPWFNDDLGISRLGTAFRGDFNLSVLVWHGSLNEDPEGRDEIFASVSSSTGWSTSTQNVYGYF